MLKRIWEEPYIVRNGRSGQRQHGVDCYGFPKHRGVARANRYAGAQCKRTDELTFEIVQEEVQKAKEFKPGLTEYLVMTTAPRDAKLQESVRTQDWSFDRVHIMFWEGLPTSVWVISLAEAQGARVPVEATEMEVARGCGSRAGWL